jgi:hypothetical protein
MSRYSGGVKSKSSSKQRRSRVITRLEAQKKKGIKIIPEWSGNNPIPVQREYPLEPKDIARIDKEIETLKTRV